MKNALLFLLLAILATTTAKAQGDYFAPIGAEWYYGAKSQYNYPHYSVFHVEKDTVVAGVNCRKITGAYVSRDSAARPLDDIYVYSTPDTVFYYNHSFKRFTPLYIFNVEVGDTVAYNSPYFEYLPHFSSKFSTPPNDSVFKTIIDNIEYIVINGKSLKYISLSGTYGSSSWHFGSNIYIEKIGSLYLIIPHVYPSIPEMMEIGFRCYTDHEITYQLVEPCDTIPGGTSIKDVDHLKNRISVYPNPSKENFTIRVTPTFSKPISVSITDITGRAIREFEIPKGQKEQDYSVNLPSGIYILRYIDDNVVYAQKLIIEP